MSDVLALENEPYFFKRGVMYDRWSWQSKYEGFGPYWKVDLCVGPEVLGFIFGGEIWRIYRSGRGVMDDFGNLISVERRQ